MIALNDSLACSYAVCGPMFFQFPTPIFSSYLQLVLFAVQKPKLHL